jgi:hypothetical protein
MPPKPDFADTKPQIKPLETTPPIVANLPIDGRPVQTLEANQFNPFETPPIVKGPPEELLNVADEAGG